MTLSAVIRAMACSYLCVVVVWEASLLCVIRAGHSANLGYLGSGELIMKVHCLVIVYITDGFVVASCYSH